MSRRARLHTNQGSNRSKLTCEEQDSSSMSRNICRLEHHSVPMLRTSEDAKRDNHQVCHTASQG